MKKSLAIIVLALIASLATAQKGITFVVDENLTPIDDNYTMEHFQRSGSAALSGIFHDEGVPGETRAMIAWSFADDERFYTFTGKDPFFQTVVRAYAQHRPLVLSPDMMWVLVSQGFARYVNAHSEQLRDQIVSHTGKTDLVVRSDKDLLSGDADWETMMSDFCAQIGEHTKGDIAKTITADFTTTGITERITSQITLMETMKSYFDYVVHYIACGIPSVTLTGTPQDWQKVMEKTKRLEKYGLGQWTQSLMPILTEFVNASKGKPNQAFWQRMVKKDRVNKFAGGACDPSKPTELDGWILKFFPDEDGLTPDQVPHTHKMPAERVYVDFKYQILNPADGSVLLETPLQLTAGFIGAEVDTLTHALTPKMGWVVRQMEPGDSIAKRLQTMDGDDLFSGIELRVNKVPEVLSQMPHIKKLILYFADKIELPEWMDQMTIDYFRVEGVITEEEAEALRKRFPNIDIRAVNPAVAPNSNPLVVVNGEIFNVSKQFDFKNGRYEDFAEILGVEPDDIKSITVLKDAAATAVWGSRGKNGIFEITTKDIDKQLKKKLKRAKRIDKKAKKVKAIKAGSKISGTVSDAAGPLWGANVCEFDDNGRIVASATTDINGQFTLKVRDPEHRLHFSYIGMKTIILTIDKKEYNIKMEPASNQRDPRVFLSEITGFYKKGAATKISATSDTLLEK